MISRYPIIQSHIIFIFSLIILMCQIKCSKAENGIYPEGEQHISRINDVISPGDNKIYDILIDPAAYLFIGNSWDSGQLKVVLINPDKIRVDSTTASLYEQPGLSEMFDELSIDFKMNHIIYHEVKSSDKWKIEVTADNSNDKPINYSIDVSLHQPPINFSKYSDMIENQIYEIGDSLRLDASLFKDSNPIANATVKANIMLPDNKIKLLNLFDNGTHGDSIPGDGYYSNFFTGITLNGRYSIILSAADTAGEIFNREAQPFNIYVESRQSIFTGTFEDRVVDSDGDSLFNELIINVGAKINRKAIYTIDGLLSDINENFISNYRIDTLLEAGEQTLHLHFDGNAIYNSGTDGPYVLTKLMIFNYSDTFSSDREILKHPYRTHAYNHREFQRPPINFIDDGYENIKDNDGDGFYDSLLISYKIDLINSGIYKWQAALCDSSRDIISFITGEVHLESGIDTLTFFFSGSEINQHAKNGPYTVSSVVLYNTKTNSSGYPLNKFTTIKYNYLNFE